MVITTTINHDELVNNLVKKNLKKKCFPFQGTTPMTLCAKNVPRAHSPPMTPGKVFASNTLSKFCGLNHIPVLNLLAVA